MRTFRVSSTLKAARACALRWRCASKRTVDQNGAPIYELSSLIAAQNTLIMKPVKTVLLIAVAALAANATYLPAQTEALIHIFTNSPDGAQPWGGLLLSAGTLYGTTYQGGDTNANGGILYSVNTDGTGYTVLYDFTNTPDGAVVYAGLVSQGDTLYGATAGGGTNYSGTIFSIKTNGDGDVVLHNFNLYSGGQHPHARLVLSGNTLYGTAAGDASPGWGAVFSMNTDGSDYTPLYDFTSPVSNGQFLTNADGEQPGGGVVLSGGTLYGTAYGGGANGVGTVYSLSTNGDDFTVLHTFAKTTFDPTYGMTNPDGAYLQAGLAGSGNTLYGTVLNGGSQGRGTVFSVNTDGSGFKVLHTFLANGQDGQHPWGSLLLAGQTLYGTTIGGGTNGRGTVFSI